MSNPKVLIVEDEKDIRELIHFHLYRNKYNVIESSDGIEAVALAKELRPDLILLDIMIPSQDGLSVCRQIREDQNLNETRIIFLSAKGEEEDIVKGLELGADDYITKPFSPKVLMARINSVLRRSDKNTDDIIEIHGIKIFDTKRKVFNEDSEVILSNTEYDLLKIFLRAPGHVYTRSQIVDLIKGTNHAVTDRSVDTQLVSLRKKLGEKGKIIETVWGVGYRLKEYEV